MKAIVAGGRNFFKGASLAERTRASDWLCGIIQQYEIDTIISGMATGADLFGYNTARENNLSVMEFPAEWNNLDATPCVIGVNKFGYKYNKLAGLNRNKEMIKHADLVILFPGGSGTKHMEDLAYKDKIEVVKYLGESL